MADQNTQVPPQASGSVDNDKLMGILSYLGILILIPLLATKNRSTFLNYHVNQGLNLIIVAIIGWIVFSFLGALILCSSFSIIFQSFSDIVILLLYYS